MKKIYIIIFVLIIVKHFAQVGINTPSPKASLDVKKKSDITFADGFIPPRISGDSLRLKASSYGENQHGALVYVTSPVTNPNASEEPKTQDIGISGYYVYDAHYMHSNNTKGLWNKILGISDPSLSRATYAAKASGSLQLLDLSLNLLGSAVRTLAISNTSNSIYTVEIPSPSVSNNSYIVPSDGLYHINYSFRTGQGLRAELLGNNRPGVIITKTPFGSTTTTTLDYRLFGGLQLLDAGIISAINISVTQGQISHIYRLKAGDVLRFGVVQGGLAIGVLNDASAELSIYKVR